MILRVRGILFDMDGVLVSSLGSVERSWKTWAQSRGIDPAFAIRTAHGRRAIETVRILRPDLNDEQELRWLEEMEIEDKDGLEILHGVRPILESLPEKYWTVVTSATDRLARARMAYGGIPVPARMITADMVRRASPILNPIAAVPSFSASPPATASSSKTQPPEPKPAMLRAVKCLPPSFLTRWKASPPPTGS